MKLFVDIPNYEGKYKIIGRFVPESGRGGRYYKERILKPHLDKYGYY